MIGLSRDRYAPACARWRGVCDESLPVSVRSGVCTCQEQDVADQEQDAAVQEQDVAVQQQDVA